MSLFPAAAGASDASKQKHEGAATSGNWLENSSFRPAVAATAIPADRHQDTASRSHRLEDLDTDSDSEMDGYRRKPHRRRRHRRHRSSTDSEGDNDCRGRHHSGTDGDSDEDRHEHHHGRHKKKKGSKGERSSWRERVQKGARSQESDHSSSIRSDAGRKTVWLSDGAGSSEATFFEDRSGDFGSPNPSRHEDGAIFRHRFRNRCVGLRDNLQLCYADYRRSSRKKDRPGKRSRGQAARRYYAYPAARAMLQPGEAVVTPSSVPLAVHHDQFLPVSMAEPVQEESPPVAVHARYHSLLAKDPHNVELWLKFVDDDSSHGIVDVLGSRVTFDAIHERKLAIVDEALVKNPSSIGLVLRRCELVAALWSEHDVCEHWVSVLASHRTSHRIWSCYLRYVRCASHSTFDSVCSDFSQCIGTLAEASAVEAQPDREDFLLEVLSSYCSFLQEAGYTERAVTMYQALLEFNMFCPDDLRDARRESRLACFAEFWQNSAGRVGMPGGYGWTHWHRSRATESGGGSGAQAPPSLDLPSIGKDTEDVVPSVEAEQVEEEDLLMQLSSADEEGRSKAWLTCELSRECRHWCPAGNAEAGGNEEDLDQCVPYSQVQCALFVLLSPEQHLRLLLDLLRFLGVEVSLELPFVAFPESQVAWECSSFHELAPLLNGTWGSTHALCRCGASHGVGHCIMRPTDGVRALWLSCARIQHFVTVLFSQAVPCFFGDLRTQLVQVWLHHQAHRCSLSLSSCQRESWLSDKVVKKHTKAVRAWAKALLKRPENRSNVALWELYGRFELAAGMRQNAYAVFGEVLAEASRSNDGADLARSSPALCRLYRTYSEALSGLLDPCDQSCDRSQGADQALRVLSASVGGKPYAASELTATGRPSATELVRARCAFESVAEQLHSTAGDDASSDAGGSSHAGVARAAHLACLHCLFVYHTGDMGSVRRVAFRYVETLRQRSGGGDTAASKQPCEAVLSFLVHLHHRRFREKAVPLRECTGVIEKALELFPCNCEWLALYYRLLSSVHLVSQCRRFVDRHSLGTTAPSFVWAAVIMLELERFPSVADGQRATSVPAYSLNRVRNLLERALKQPPGVQSILLWRLFLHVESVFGGMDWAEAILYRSLQKCPLAKPLYLDGIRLFGFKLRDLTETMNAKAVRTRMPLEEFDIVIRYICAVKAGHVSAPILTS